MLEPASCAVVITYHPDIEGITANLQALSTQTAAALVIDNGSDQAQLEALRSACHGLGYALVENGANLGIARALNQGIHWARGIGAASIFFFDQDSAVPQGFCQTMLACLEKVPSASSVAILVPRYVDERDGTVLYPPGRTGGELQAATTSGSLTPMHVFDRVGEFAEELFIDGVDYEFSLRVRAHGMVVRECARAMLLHNPGATTQHRLFGVLHFRSSNYSPARRYYQTRNRLLVTRRYWRRFPGFCAWQLWVGLKDFSKTALAERDRGHKLRFFVLGLLDGLRGRTGPLPDQSRPA